MFESTIICGQIYLGKQGEHNARRFTFNDVKIWQELFGEGHCEVLHQRNGDLAPYPVTLTIEDGVPYWYVSEVDTAISGEGKCEIRYIVNDAIVKSSIYVTMVQESLGEEITDVPDPYRTWVDQVIEAGATAKESAIQAEQSARNAEVAKSGAEGCVIQAEAHSQTAKQHADTAEGYAKDSGGASMAASQSADEAFRSANEAKGYAENVSANTQIVVEKAEETSENAKIVTDAVNGINSTFANALKGTVKGVGAVRIDDASPIPHNVEIKTDVDTTFKTYGKNIFDYKNSTWEQIGLYYYSYDIPNLTDITIRCDVAEGTKPVLSVQKNNNGTWSKYGDFLAYSGVIKTVTIDKPGQYRFAMRDTAPVTKSEDSWIEKIQIEVGTQATDIEEYEEPIEGVAMVYPTNTIVADTPGANIEITYNRDINKAFAELQRALLSIGGNI